MGSLLHLLVAGECLLSDFVPTYFIVTKDAAVLAYVCVCGGLLPIADV